MWKGRNPDYDVTTSINPDSVSRGDSIVLTIQNTGKKSINFNHSYEVQRGKEDGTFESVELNVVWITELVELSKGETWTQVVYTDLSPGRYRIDKRGGSEGGNSGMFLRGFVVE